jgi:hypothetical protein
MGPSRSTTLIRASARGLYHDGNLLFDGAGDGAGWFGFFFPKNALDTSVTTMNFSRTRYSTSVVACRYVYVLTTSSSEIPR